MTVPPTLGVRVLTLAEARAMINEDVSQTAGPVSDDALVNRSIDSATEMIERYTGPIVVKLVTKTWNGGATSFVLPWKPLTAYDMTLTESGNVLLAANGDFDVDADAGILYRGHWPVTRWFWQGRNNIVFTCYVGREVVPGIIKDAVAQQFRNTWQRTYESNGRPGLGAQTQMSTVPDIDPIEMAKAAYGSLPGFA